MSQNPFHSPNRRWFIAGGAALGTLSLLPKGAYAADPYRFSHGAFEITVLSDGFIMLPAEIILPDTAPDERPDILKRLGGTPASAPFHVNIPLIRTGNDLILVDTGSGDKFQASAGKLAANLRAAGVDHQGRLHPCPSGSFRGHHPARRQAALPQRPVFCRRRGMAVLDRSEL